MGTKGTCDGVLSDYTKALHDAVGLNHDGLTGVSNNDYHNTNHESRHVSGVPDVEHLG